MADPRATLARGIELFKEGAFDQAVDVLEDATRQDEWSYDAWVYLGAAYAQQGRQNLVIGALRRACEIEPNSPKIHYNLGQAYESAGVPREAWFEYKRALELDSNYGLARGALVALSKRTPALLSPSIEIAA
jgi:Flp pilus assembly protein TadD